MTAQHASPKPRRERSNVLDTRPPTEVPAERPIGDTQVIPLIPDGSDGSDPAADALIPPHTTQHDVRVNPDDLRPKTGRHWATGSVPMGVAAGVPSPDQVFLNPAAADFQKWAEGWLSEHAPAVQAKAQQYGSNSLAASGRKLARLQGRQVSDIEALELGCFDYAHGKMERVFDAVLREQLPGRDTWHDIAVYSLMVLFMREFGRWP